MIRGREWRPGCADIEAAGVGQVVAAASDDALQLAERRDVGTPVAVHDNDVGVEARREAASR